MYIKSELYRVEEGFWLKGQEHFLKHLDEHCLLAFPQAGEMHGVFDRSNVAASANPSNRWRDLTMRDRHLLQVGEIAMISYRADVIRSDGFPYVALVSSAYVHRPDGWKLAFHQHSPVSLPEVDHEDLSEERGIDER